MVSVRQLLSVLADKLFPVPHTQIIRIDIPSIVQSLTEAKADWDTAEAYFNFVSDPLLVDQAVYRLAAAERRYSYLLNLARTQAGQVDS